MTHPDLPEILSKLRDYLQQEYGDRLAHIVLYGSQARKEATEQSDIDILVVLKAPLNVMQEIQRTSEFITDLCLENTVLVSLGFASLDRFKQEKTPFFLNVHREGILV